MTGEPSNARESLIEQISSSRRRFMEATGGVVTAASLADVAAATHKEKHENNGHCANGHGTPRVNKLIAQMTLEEKVGQMTQKVIPTGAPAARDIQSLAPEDAGELFTEFNLGSILSGGAAPPTYDPTELVKSVNELQKWVIENTRLGIPFVYGVDAVHGNDLVYESPIFPHNLGIGATWDPELTETLGQITGESVRATGPHWTFSPGNDIQRDPRWGRFYEGFSESPYLASELGRAKVKGYQSPSEEYDIAAGACQKHLAGYSEPANGNDRDAAHIPMRSLRDIFFPPYRAGVEAGAETVMVNSGSVNGIPAHASPWLLTEVLREEWGFEGMVVSDWKDFKRMVTMHNYATDLKQATKLGVNAGVDMYMNPDDVEEFTTILVELVEEGEVKRQRINEAVRRILTFKEHLGLFDDPFVDPDLVETKVKGAGREEARQAATESMTLLQNEEETLPLDSNIGSLLVTGPRIDHPLMQMGGWTLGWQGLPIKYTDVNLDRVPSVTMLEGITEAVSSSTDVVSEPIEHEWLPYNTNDDFAIPDPGEIEAAARDADAAVVVVGDGPYSEGFGDTNELHLHPVQQDLVDIVSSTGTPTVGVFVAGRPRGTEVFEKLDAAVMAYQPGTAGGRAVADVLFGNVNPGGHLPFRWPESVGQTVNVHNELYPNNNPPLFEFGHGLSYTEFSYEGLRVMPMPDHLNVRVRVTNTGARAGDDVVQVLATRDGGPVIYPQQQVIGFERVHLEPGQTKHVEIEAPLSTLATVPGDMPANSDERIVAPGEYDITVEELTTTITVGSR